MAAFIPIFSDTKVFGLESVKGFDHKLLIKRGLVTIFEVSIKTQPV